VGANSFAKCLFANEFAPTRGTKKGLMVLRPFFVSIWRRARIHSPLPGTRPAGSASRCEKCLRGIFSNQPDLIEGSIPSLYLIKKKGLEDLRPFFVSIWRRARIHSSLPGTRPAGSALRCEKCLRGIFSNQPDLIEGSIPSLYLIKKRVSKI